MIYDELQALVQKEVLAVFPDWNKPVTLEQAANSKFGDYATTVALSLAKQYQQSPLDIAKQIVSQIQAQPRATDILASIEAVPPGFINLTLKDSSILAE